MILEIYSKFGVLECKPMTLQAIENSILVGTNEQNQELEGEPAVAEEPQAEEPQAETSD